MKKLIITLFMVLFIFTNYAFSADEQIDDLTLYFFTSNVSKTIEWDNITEASHYHFRLWSVERKEFALMATVPNTEEDRISITINVPFTGHFHAYIRSVVQPFNETQIADINSKESLEALKLLIPAACDLKDWWDDTATLDAMKAKMIETNSQCSLWTISTDPESCLVELPDGTTVNKGWWLYGYPAPPTGGGIIQ